MTYYLLQHGDELWESAIAWLPSQRQEPVANVLRLSFQNYFIGQLIIGLCFSVTLVPLFLILQVPFGLLFGLTVGTMALIPFGATRGDFDRHHPGLPPKHLFGFESIRGLDPGSANCR